MQMLSNDNFEAEVVKSSHPVVIDYFAEWCQPCKMIAPVLEKISGQIKNVKFFKINVDENTSLAHEQGVMGIPCIIIYKKGEEVDRIVGFQTEDQLKAKLSKTLESL